MPHRVGASGDSGSLCGVRPERCLVNGHVEKLDRLQCDLEFGEIFCRYRHRELCEVAEQVILPGLAERQPIDGQAAFEPFQSLVFTTKRQHGDATFDANRAFENPVGHQVALVARLRTSLREHRGPRVLRRVRHLLQG
jgi:hypothetical protein